MIKLKWKSIIDDLNLEDLAMNIGDFLKPTSSKDLNNLYHGKDKYCFLPDFSQYVDKGKDFFGSCKTKLSDYFLGNVTEANTQFHEYLLGQTPDVFVPFMQNVLSPELGINAFNLYSPENIDVVNLDNVWQAFGFDNQGQLLSDTGIIDTIQTVLIPEVLPIPIEQSGGFLDSVGETIGNITESIGDAISNVDWGSVAEAGLSIIGKFFGIG